MPDDDPVMGAVHAIGEVEPMVDRELEVDETPPEAAVVARSAPGTGRRYLVATPESYPAPEGVVGR